MHYVYIIYSNKLGRFYIGETAFVKKRIKQHNTGKYKKGFTKASDDWELVKAIPFQNRGQALKAENFIKRMKSRKFIKKIIDNHQFLYDI